MRSLVRLGLLDWIPRAPLHKTAQSLVWRLTFRVELVDRRSWKRSCRQASIDSLNTVAEGFLKHDGFYMGDKKN